MFRQLYLILLSSLLCLKMYCQQTPVPPPPFIYQTDFKKILEQTQERESPLYYQKLLIRFLDRDSTLSNPEVLALLIGYTEDSHFKPFEDMETEQEIFDLNEERQYEEALVKAKQYLQSHPLSLRVLKEASFCYYVKEMQDSADYYMDLVDKIMNAMTYSGNGKKPDAPMFALGLADGEYYVQNIGLKVSNRDTDWNKHNQFIEIVEGSKNADDKVKYFFVIQHAKNRVDDDKVNESAGKKKKKKPAAEKRKQQDKPKDKKSKDKKDKPAWQTEEAAPPAEIN
ncbi:MAG TPA: DUF4919 domain-containing protein [Ferruginibacter sp.]|nr:DUF4919 domain-containing protein [Ferruginibacter sp.]HMP22105.1 DUF4919 domain-containing protein [Ferruginibacter sp.]